MEKVISEKFNVDSLWFAFSDVIGAKTGTSYGQKTIAQFTDAGLNCFAIDCDLEKGWQKNKRYDSSLIIKEIKNVIKVNSNAKIIMRLHLNPPYWWMEENPNELVVYDGAERVNSKGYGERVICKFPPEIQVSCASKKWLNDCSKKIAQLYNDIEKSGLLTNFKGFHIAYGPCGEWHLMGKFYDDGKGIYASDYSEPMLKYFRAYIKKKYKTAENLKVAYADKTAEFDNVVLARANDLITLNNGEFRLSCDKSCRCLDTLKVFHLSVTTAIEYVAKRIKNLNPDMLVGVFYAYYFGVGDIFGLHAEPQKLLQSKHIDFFGAPPAYNGNRVAGNCSMFRNLPESARLNGKLSLIEMDYKPIGIETQAGGKAEGREETIALIKRNMLEAVIRGQGGWYYDHQTDGEWYRLKEYGYWDNPELLETIKSVQSFALRTSKKPFVKTTEVLVVFNPKSTYHLVNDESFNTYNQFDLLNALGKSGVGYDLLYLSDLKKVDLTRYKCFIFVNCQKMEDGEYAFVKNKVMGKGKSIVFIGKCGYIKTKSYGVNNVKNLVQLDLESDFSQGKIGKDLVYYFKYYVKNACMFKQIFKQAGVRIYTENSVVTVADNNMLLIHSSGIERVKISLTVGEFEYRLKDKDTIVIDCDTGEKLF